MCLLVLHRCLLCAAVIAVLCRLLSAGCFMLCVLPAVRCSLLFVICCWLFVDGCLLMVVCGVRVVVAATRCACWLLRAVRCVFFLVYICIMSLSFGVLCRCLLLWVGCGCCCLRYGVRSC